MKECLWSLIFKVLSYSELNGFLYSFRVQLEITCFSWCYFQRWEFLGWKSNQPSFDCWRRLNERPPALFLRVRIWQFLVNLTLFWYHLLNISWCNCFLQYLQWYISFWLLQYLPHFSSLKLHFYLSGLWFHLVIKPPPFQVDFELTFDLSLSFQFLCFLDQ